METKTILIKNTTILAKGLRKGSVLIEDGKIIDINNKIRFWGIDEVIDAEGKILIPGLVNTHTHLSMNLMRGLADDLPLDVWMNDHIWPVEAHLEGEHCYAGALLAALEMIKSGTTTCDDMYFFMDDVARAIDESGIRGLLCHGMIDLFDEEKRKAECKETKRIIEKCHNTADGRIQVALGPHTPYTCSTELLNWVRKKADEKGLKIHIHVSETEKEVEDSLNDRKKRPFEYLDDIKFLGPDVIAAHAVWLSGAEIALIKENNVKISHNPLSNMKLASGISPVSDMLANGICVSLGTDGAASNNSLDLFQEMKIASLLQKVRTLDPTVLPAGAVLEMATMGGATALGMEKEIGTIEVGKKADLVLMDRRAPHLTPYRNPVSHLVYSAEGPDVSTVICNGEILMRENEVLVLDEMEVIEMAENASEDLLSRR
ncbi:amidohydrolase family protein [Methanobacterium petrolearium]|uniref:amidohydrolase family protein n=1 Tax=Methanobacterium petrolearium TaxID=710190 RepID=UPI001AE7B222|nr:amidohydrolase family protein [Methanobacterium petrolearium]MBP1944929.1 5-methylthioadenosine/S-adenosylhomocysteine deaminase [Methanobacterium petrolearium]BDZ70243.1 N-ethylammeline chlorohydrolase [Methanobacterium petrolearium]